MMQRNKSSRTSTALAAGQSAALRIALSALTTAVLVVLVLITGPSSAGYGFA